jgi:hypothetical protein
MRSFRRKAQLTCILSAILLVLTAGYASAQSFPSQIELNTAQSGGLDFPTQLPLFASLAADANGIIANVTTGHFSNASALLAHYNSTIKQITSSANASQQGTTIGGSATPSQGSREQSAGRTPISTLLQFKTGSTSLRTATPRRP